MDKRKKEVKYYCPICGNGLNPKIHHKPEELGKTSKEMAKLQKDLLREVLKSFYFEDRITGKKFHFESIIDSIMPKERGEKAQTR